MKTVETNSMREDIHSANGPKKVHAQQVIV